MAALFSLTVLALFTPSMSTEGDDCRSLDFTVKQQGKALLGHVIRSIRSESCELCQIECFLEEKCISYNCGGQVCDLNSSDHILDADDLVEDEAKLYVASQNACNGHDCSANQGCVNGFGPKGYECRCLAGFLGDHCEKAVVHGGWASWAAWGPCSATTCGGQGTRKRARNCTDPCPQNGGDPCHGLAESVTQCTTSCSCKEFLEQDPSTSSVNQAYPLLTKSGHVQVYCHMTEIPGCGESAWTLVMKIDGSKQTFTFDSSLWLNQDPHEIQSGMTGLDGNETKLPTYWSTPFTKICLGIKVGHTSTFKAFKWEATSLHSLISPGKTNTTQLGRDWWKSLIGGSSLQWRCNEEGFNVGLGSLSGSYSLARIGIVGNNENHCDTCDSFIGLGTKHKHHPIACGNFAAAKPDNGDRSTPAMCYLFIL